MDPEVKQILKEELQLHKDSLSILKKLHHDVIYRRVFNLLKWAVTIGLVVFGYVQARPYIDRFLNTITEVQSALPKAGSISGKSLQDIQNLLPGLLKK